MLLTFAQSFSVSTRNTTVDYSLLHEADVLADDRVALEGYC